METEHTTCILGAPGYDEKCQKTMEKWGPGPPIKSALKGGWGCFGAALKRGGGGSGILESAFELYIVELIAAKKPGCRRYM